MRIRLFVVLSFSLLLAHKAALADSASHADSFDDFEAKLHGIPPVRTFLPPPSANPNAPQTPEELQALMEQESLDQQRKIMGQRAEMIRRIRQFGVVPRNGDSPFKGMTPVDSKITDVTAYSDHAKVTRAAEVKLVKGPQLLVFRNMPRTLTAETVRAEGVSRGNTVKIGAIQYKTVEVPFDTDAGDRPAFEKLDTLETEARRLLAEKQAAESQKEFFETVSNTAVTGKEGAKGAAPELTPDKWLKASAAYRDGMTQILKEVAARDARLDEIGRELGSEESLLLRKYWGRNWMNIVLVPVEADAPGTLSLKLAYQVENVSWQPLYDVNLSTDKAAADIVQYARVNQATGEDWQDVALTLSTAPPQQNAELPAPKTFWIDIMEPEPVVSAARKPTPAGDPLAEWRARTEAKRLEMEQQDGNVDEDEANAEQPEVVPLVTPIHPQPAVRVIDEPRPIVISPSRIVTGGTVSQYAIPGRTTVAADGGETKLLIGSFAAEGKLQVLIRPRHAALAQLLLHFTLRGGNPIMAGQANMFRDGVYSGQVELPLMEPGAEHDFSLGVDEQVVVTRDKLRDERQEQGLIRKDSLVAREYVTEIRNLHAEPVDVIVQESTPTPKNERLAVDLRPDFTTPGYRKDDDNVKGLLTWEFTMKPQEKKAIDLGWTVNWPKDYLLLGIVHR